MVSSQKPISRRQVLSLMGLAAVAVPLAACAATPGGTAFGTPSATPVPTLDAKNPFGVTAGTTVDSVIFDNAKNTEFFAYLAKELEKSSSALTLAVTPSAQIAQQVQPRFVAGNPPDLLHSAGAGSIPVATLLPSVLDLNDLVDAPNLEGDVIRDAVYPGVLELADFDGKLAAINYSLSVHALWYSRSLFSKMGWKAPRTWDEAMDLGAAAKKEGKYLFTWGKEAASYYLSMAIDSAIKEGGNEVRVALANLEPKSWGQPAVKAAFTAMKKAVDAGYFLPGGAGTQFKAAQAQWSLRQEAIMYPSGSWIEAEMGAEIADGFEMVGAPNPTVTTKSALPYEAIRFAGGNRFVVPTAGANTVGAKETLRTMLSRDAAIEFARINKSPTILRNTVPKDGFGSTALVSATDLLEQAGTNAYAWDFTDAYPFGDDKGRVMNDFLSGGMSVADALSELQKASDRIREDDTIVKIKAS